MKIDILSDTHFNSHFKYIREERQVIEFWNRLKPKGDYLIIAGDIGEDNNQNIFILNILKKHFYKNIICVLGNHDYYLIKNEITYYYDEKHILRPKMNNIKFKTSNERIEDFKIQCKENNINLLDGDIIYIEDKIIGGTMGSYSSDFYNINATIIDKVYCPNPQKLFQECMADYNYIYPNPVYDWCYNSEINKINEVLKQEPDIMITHVSPLIDKKYQNPRFKNDLSTTFFCFNGIKQLNNFKGNYWIFGHSHFETEFDYKNENEHNFKLLSNCLGYQSEYGSIIKTIEI